MVKVHRTIGFAFAVLVIAARAVLGDPSDQVTFRTITNAPSGFTEWTFFWNMPAVDPDAHITYVVMQPDGAEYFRYAEPIAHQEGDPIRSDFAPAFAGGDPGVFYGHPLRLH